MSSSTRSPSVKAAKVFAYENFQGLDTSRDITSLDTGKDQHLTKVQDAYCDWRGQIVRDPSATFRKGDLPVNHVSFFSSSEVCWAEETGAGINLKSERDHIVEEAYDLGSVISSTVFNQGVIFASRSNPIYRYDGAIFEKNLSPAINQLLPAYTTSVQRRLAVAGINGKETQVHLSRVDQDEIFPADEDEGSTNALRAGFIDIANLLNTSDTITGIGSFEQNRLVIFTRDKAIVYRIDPDITAWVLDDNANINIGCASHNTIKNAGTDLLFCSRSGVHSIKRSEENGLLVYSYSLSDKVDLLYRQFFNSVENPEEISAVFDQDQAHYHVYFPQSSGETKRLTLALNPEGGQPQPKFSSGTFLKSRCGAFLGGSLVLGTAGGVYNVLAPEAEKDDAVTPQLEVVTPYLWHGSLTDVKETNSLIIQASGKGNLEVDAIDLDGKLLGSLVVEVDNTLDDKQYEGVALSRQYERKWQHRYLAAQYRIKSVGGSGLFRIIGLAVTVRT
jgi:hypothetical protein